MGTDAVFDRDRGGFIHDWEHFLDSTYIKRGHEPAAIVVTNTVIFWRSFLSSYVK